MVNAHDNTLLKIIAPSLGPLITPRQPGHHPITPPPPPSDELCVLVYYTSVQMS